MVKVKCVKFLGTDRNNKLCQNLGDGIFDFSRILILPVHINKRILSTTTNEEY